MLGEDLQVDKIVFFDSLLWIRATLLFFQSSRNTPLFIIDLNINFNEKVIKSPQVLIIFIDN